MERKKDKNLKEKQPVVVLVGHIDHGKSSILEAVKDLKVLEKESGGITQHISAYEVEEKGKKITFIDTPGHAAFSAMRARGAQVADIAILVVAADEGVEDQTREVIQALKETGTPVIVAINKVDKPGADPEKVKSQLAKEEIVVEEREGSVPSVETSAENGKGIKELLELIILVSEMEDLRSNFDSLAEGVVIESFTCSKRGPLSTLLIREGVLREGDTLGTKAAVGRVKRLENFKGERIEKAEPGQAVLVLGFKELPRVGDEFRACPSMEEAKSCLIETEEKNHIEENKAKKTMGVILKVDVLGSLKPVEKVLSSIPQERIGLRILRKDVGDISLVDVETAEACGAVVIGFRVGVLPSAAKKAEEFGVKVFTFDIIYELKEGVKKLMEQFLGPQKVRANLAKLKVLAVFKRDRRRQVIGAKIEKGEVRKGNKIEVFKKEEGKKIKSGEGVGEGRIVSLEQNKREIKKGREGDQVGILYEGSGTIEEGDILAAFEIREKKIEL